MRAQDARKIPLPQLLQALGHAPAFEKGGELWYCSPFRQESKPSFKTDRSKLLWFDHGMGKGGNIIDFGFAYFNTTSVSAVLRALDDTLGHGQPNTPSLPLERPGTAENAPERTKQNEASSSPSFEEVSLKALHSPALRHYLRTRGIDVGIARQHVKEIHYSYQNKRYFALAFPNEQGGYELRNPYFKGAYGPKAISWMKNQQGGLITTVRVFEGFMDYLSFLTWQASPAVPAHALVLNSVSMAEPAIEKIKNMTVTDVQLYLDWDEAGRHLAQNLRTALPGQTVHDLSNLYAGHKDLNDWWKAREQQAALAL